MAVITRHILAEFCKVFLIALSAVLVVIVLADTVKELQARGFRTPQIALILPYLMPYAIKSSLHAALLFAACNVFGRMAASNELLALKSLGISPLATIWPVLLLVVPLSFGAVWLDEIDATWGDQGVERVLINHFEEVTYGILERTRVYQRPQFDLVVQQVKNRRLIRPTLTLREGEQTLTVTAEEGELRVQPAENTLRIILRRGSFVGNNYQGSFPDAMEHTVPLEMPLREAYTWKRCERQQVVLSSIAREARATIAANPAAAPEVRQKWEEAYHELNRLKTQCMHKWANGFCCLFFVLIGGPAAMVFRFDSWLANFFACFLPIIVIYQPLHKLPIYLAESGMAPAYLVWGGDLLLGIVGLEMLRRIVRY